MSDFATQLSADLQAPHLPAGPGSLSGSGLPDGNLPDWDLPDWVGAVRARGADTFRQHGLPTRKDETWKYTRLGFLVQRNTRLALAGTAQPPAIDWPAPIIEVEQQVRFINGALQPVSTSVQAGLQVLSLRDAVQQDIPGLQKLLESLPPSHERHLSAGGFSALNDATLDNGMVVHVAAGVDAGRLLTMWSAGDSSSAELFNTRICLILEAGASMQWLEQFETAFEHSNSGNIVVQVQLAEGASLRHCRLQHEGQNAGLVTRTEVDQQSSSSYAYFGFDLGGGWVRHDLHARLLGENARASLNGAYILDNSRHVDNHAKVDHIAKNGYSEQYFRGVVGDSSKAVFNTAVVVFKGADGAEAHQSNANILLSKLAEINTKPELEVYADEVIAEHGATVGQLDEAAVFYLRSRGINELQARQMLTMAFCRSVSDKLIDRKLASALSRRIMDVMPELEEGGE